MLEMLQAMWQDLGPIGVGSLVLTLIGCVVYCRLGHFFEDL